MGRRTLTVGFVFSLAVHLLAAGLLGVRPHWNDTTPTPSKPQPRIKTPQLGIDRGAPATITWIGFEQYREHLAPKAAVAQAALAINPTRPTMPIPTKEIRTAVESSAAEAAVAVRSVADALKQVIADARVLQSSRLAKADARQQDAQPDSPKTRQVAEAAKPKPVHPSPTPPSPPLPPSPPNPGEASDRESDATALAEAVRVRPGRPVAAKGLDIKTRRPQWGTTTLLTAFPANPVVVVEFNRSGKVAGAWFARDGKRVLSTGYKDVDEPLLNAVYTWTAAGKALRKLPEDDPDATVRIVLSVVLRQPGG